MREPERSLAELATVMDQEAAEEVAQAIGTLGEERAQRCPEELDLDG